ncbi:MAG: twin-arginine translocase TatA/TatE family subunit [Anaerolineales bacterium]
MPRGSELIIILIIIILVFGVGRLSKLGEDLGKGIRSFRKGLSGEEEPKDEEKKPK